MYGSHFWSSLNAGPFQSFERPLARRAVVPETASSVVAEISVVSFSPLLENAETSPSSKSVL